MPNDVGKRKMTLARGDFEHPPTSRYFSRTAATTDMTEL